MHRHGRRHHGEKARTGGGGGEVTGVELADHKASRRHSDLHCQEDEWTELRSPPTDPGDEDQTGDNKNEDGIESSAERIVDASDPLQEGTSPAQSKEPVRRPLRLFSNFETSPEGNLSAPPPPLAHSAVSANRGAVRAHTAADLELSILQRKARNAKTLPSELVLGTASSAGAADDSTKSYQPFDIDEFAMRHHRARASAKVPFQCSPPRTACSPHFVRRSDESLLHQQLEQPEQHGHLQSACTPGSGEGDAQTAPVVRYPQTGDEQVFAQQQHLHNELPKTPPEQSRRAMSGERNFQRGSGSPKQRELQGQSEQKKLSPLSFRWATAKRYVVMFSVWVLHKVIWWLNLLIFILVSVRDVLRSVAGIHHEKRRSGEPSVEERVQWDAVRLLESLSQYVAERQ